LTECYDLSEVEAEEMETAVVAVKTAETAEALETAAVTLMTVVLTIKAAATLVMTTAAAAVTALIEAAVTERAAAVYWRGRWFVSNVSDVRTMWNITLDSVILSWFVRFNPQQNLSTIAMGSVYPERSTR
jgi:hypothetical protein